MCLRRLSGAPERGTPRISPISGMTAIAWLVAVMIVGCSSTQEATAQVEASATGSSRDGAIPTSAPAATAESDPNLTGWGGCGVGVRAVTCGFVFRWGVS